ncbi:hypothetical protein TNCV_2300481 [Trichonephila clavipes]|nr:hypothetical protein TNCV_2300481 [Trichonephila clavipes]
MSRFGGLSEERPSVFKTRSKLGTHLSTQCSGDERQSRPCAALNRLEYIKLYGRNSNLGHHTGQANAVRGIDADEIRCSQLASLDKNNALREINLRLSYLQGKSTTMSVIAHQTEKEWISANKKSRQRMSQTQAEGAAEQHADRLEDAHLRAHHSCFTTSERC